MNGKRLQFAASPGVVGKVRDAVRRLAADLGAAESVGDQLALVADELINNAIEHGSVYRRRGESLALEVAAAAAGRLRIEFVDPEMPGELVARLAAHVAEATGGLPALDSERGRGLFLLTVFLQDLRVEAAGAAGGLRIVGHVATS
ncbi:MAG: ATP-binding protein [Phycisphaerales bacterium]|jgi:anti-sigma regulatory factor (Ser/Thr protein kinase)|nr:ATP-binding protein [Phycisphaerales bacterium]